MSNRLVSLLILIVTFWSIYGLYYYFFVLNKGELTLTTNIDTYKVTLYNSKLKTSFATDCLQSVCELIDLAPFQYEMTLSREWYKDVNQTITIVSWEKLQIQATFEKQLIMEQIETPVSETLNTETQIEQVRELSFLQKTYKYFQLPNLGYFYFHENDDNSLSLLHNNGIEIQNLYSFAKIERKLLDIIEIDQTNNSLLITHGDDKYIYDLWNNSIEKIYFPQKVNFIKKWKNSYHFVNDKGTFLYDNTTKKIEYFYLFKDFIYYDDENYLWVISSSEIEKKKNYNLENTSWNLIVKYNFKTRAIKVLETTNINISKITLENKNVYFYDAGGNKYEVKNIE